MLKTATSLFAVGMFFMAIVWLDSAIGTDIQREGSRTYIIDQIGERWDITQAQSLGFHPENFQYGIGRNALQTLDDSNLNPDASFISPHLRVIGVTDGTEAHAYSVSKLWRHEIANTNLGLKSIAVGY